ANRLCFHFAQLEAKRFDDVVLLYFGLAVEEHRGLAEMIEEARTPFANFLRVDPFRIARESAHVHTGLKRTTTTKTIRIVTRPPAIDRLSHEPVTIVIVNRCDRSINWYFVEVWSAKSRQLRVEIRKQTTLKQWIVSEINSGNDVAEVKCDLFSLGKEVVGIAV